MPVATSATILPRVVQAFRVVDSFAQQQGQSDPYPAPISRIHFYLIGREVGGVVQRYLTPLEMIMRRNPSGLYLFFGRVRRPNGTAFQVIRMRHAPRPAADTGADAAQVDRGLYLVRLECPNRMYQPREVIVAFPLDLRIDLGANPPVIPQPTRVDLAPGYAYSFPDDRAPSSFVRRTVLRGAVFDRLEPPRRGIANTRVKVELQNRPDIRQDIDYVTDRTGQWVLVFPIDYFQSGQDTDDITLSYTRRDKRIESATKSTIQRGEVRNRPPDILPELLDD